MKNLTPDELRQSCLDFFTARGHTLVKSDSLVPENDPTLLFTGAGMNQFKEQFLGIGEMPFTRATSCQKCFRTGDLENVGRTTYHHTFFEMLGNFSFGDYFKRDAIRWAWEYLTGVLEIPGDRLWVSVYEDDDEAYGVWIDEVGLPSERMRRFGAKTNFWPADAPKKGPNGVCGPCSEIFFDYGPEYGPDPAADCDDYDGPRFCEVWNLVFTQFERTGVDQLEPLPQKNIDTGMGFERLVAVLAGELSTFGTDLFLPIIGKVSEISGIPYAFDSEDGVRMRRIADHARAAAFCLVDGVKPGREGRDFVLRRVIRRAVRDGIGIGLDRPFLADLAPVVIQVMGRAYPELVEGLTEIQRQLSLEEERFRSTYFQGMNALDDAVERLKAEGGMVLPGEVAFRLHDERGFPVDLTEDYLREQGLSLDRDGFDEAMEARRKQSQAGSKLDGDIFVRGPLDEVRTEHGATVFTGYETTRGEATVLAVITGEGRTEEVGGGRFTLVTDRTPFYAESGGQVGDAGSFTGPGGAGKVLDTQAVEGVYAMSAEMTDGRLAVGDRVDLVVDEERRDAIRRNHTATHLLHRALKNHLGEGAVQAGSLVAPDRLRFDFHHEGGLTDEQVESIEAEVNREIYVNTPLDTREMALADAKASGAVSLFGEKYADEVRVVTVGDYSKELCGGTHCRATGDIGSLRIVSETNIGAGMRRIEAVTGEGAVDLVHRDRRILKELAGELKAPAEEVPGRVAALRKEIRELKKRLDEALTSGGPSGADESRETLGNGVEVVVRRYPDSYEMKHLLAAADEIRAAGGRIAALIAAVGDGGARIVLAATDGAVADGFDAGKAVRDVAGVLGGKGGGRPDLGRGKGTDGARFDDAVARLKELAGALPRLS